MWIIQIFPEWLNYANGSAIKVISNGSNSALYKGSLHFRISPILFNNRIIPLQN